LNKKRKKEVLLERRKVQSLPREAISGEDRKSRLKEWRGRDTVRPLGVGFHSKTGHRGTSAGTKWKKRGKLLKKTIRPSTT